MDRSLTLTFARSYNLTVVAIVAVLLAFMGSVVWTSAGMQSGHITYGAVILLAISLILVPLMLTHAFDLARPRPVVIIDATGLHDRRLTRGPILWTDMQQVTLFRKGWQVVAMIELKPLPAKPYHHLSLAFPVFALNRLAAMLQKRPDLQLALGGLSQPASEIIKRIDTFCPGLLRLAS